LYSALIVTDACIFVPNAILITVLILFLYIYIFDGKQTEFLFYGHNFVNEVEVVERNRGILMIWRHCTAVCEVIRLLYCLFFILQDRRRLWPICGFEWEEDVDFIFTCFMRM